MLVTHDLSKVFKSAAGLVTAVDAINISVARGEMVSIVGKSGSGKSTLLNLLSGLERPTSGRIIINKCDISRLREGRLTRFRAQSIGFVFQAYNLIPNLNAIENVMIAMEAARLPRRSCKENAIELLHQVGLTPEQMKRRPPHLSGGQQQRIAIARALANQPDIVFADEPTGNLDENTGRAIMELLSDLAAARNTTFIIVTHDSAITEYTSKVLELKDGRII